MMVYQSAVDTISSSLTALESYRNTTVFVKLSEQIGTVLSFCYFCFDESLWINELNEFQKVLPRSQKRYKRSLFYCH